VTLRPASPRIPVRQILRGALHPPLHERSFWFVQLMVVLWAFIHIGIDIHGGLDNRYFPYGIPIDLLLIPVGYAALYYGLSGSAATTLWAILLWTPDLLLDHDKGHYHQDLVQLAVVAVVALFVGLEIERAHLERARAEAAEAERRAAERHYHQLFTTNASPIILVDASGTVVEANPAAAALWSEASGTTIDDLLGLSIHEIRTSATPRTVTMTTTAGEERTYRPSISTLDSVGEPSSYQVVLEDITEEYRSEIEARAWASEVLRAQEEERRRIAREIHDDPLQRLLQLARGIESLGDDVRPPGDHSRVDAVRHDLLETIDHLREVTRGLHPAGLDQHGLVAAVRGLLVDVEIHHEIVTQFTVDGDVVRGTPDAEVGAFRIIQEAVRNTIRHAGATLVRVEMDFLDDALHVRVIDDGCGFDANRVGPLHDRHLGLPSMRERAHLLGGHCDIITAPGAGTTVDARVPLHGASVLAGVTSSTPSPRDSVTTTLHQ
jgi:signal transduction histidine kinase